MDRARSPVDFDPWTATADEAMRAAEMHEPGTPEPLAQHQTAQEVLQARDNCLSFDGGCKVLQCLARCLANGLMPPRWLSDAFIQRRNMVVDAHAISWDAPEAFGRPWPAYTQLATVRKQFRLKAKVHAEVGRLLDEDPSQALGRDLFERVGEQKGIDVSGADAERIYYKAVREGALSYAQLRAAQRT